MLFRQNDRDKIPIMYDEHTDTLLGFHYIKILSINYSSYLSYLSLSLSSSLESLSQLSLIEFSNFIYSCKYLHSSKNER